MTIKTLYPAIRPTLDLNFAATRELDPRITFIRASSGTYVGKDGLIRAAGKDEARFDHNPLTKESLGLLVEEQRTNLCLQSEAFETTWTVAGTASITADQAVAPTGATTADRITITSGGPNRVVQSGVSATSTTYTFSVYAKSDDINGICIRAFFSGGTSIDTYSNFVFSSKTFLDTAGSGSFAYQELPNGWFRLSITIASGDNIAWEFRVGGLITTAQTGTKAFLWGAQLEAGSFPTSYIPTVSATVTRSADVASITGSNFSSWYRQDEGTIFAEYNIPFDSSASIFPVIAGSSDGTFANTALLYVRTIDDGRRAVIRNAGIAQFDQANAGAYAYGTNSKSAVAFATNNVALSVAGVAPTTSATVTIPTVDRFTIGSNNAINGSLSPLNGTIRCLIYWPRRLSDSTLRALTS